MFRAFSYLPSGIRVTTDDVPDLPHAQQLLAEFQTIGLIGGNIEQCLPGLEAGDPDGWFCVDDIETIAILRRRREQD